MYFKALAYVVINRNVLVIKESFYLEKRWGEEKRNKGGTKTVHIVSTKESKWKQWRRGGISANLFTNLIRFQLVVFSCFLKYEAHTVLVSYIIKNKIRKGHKSTTLKRLRDHHHNNDNTHIKVNKEKTCH